MQGCAPGRHRLHADLPSVDLVRRIKGAAGAADRVPTLAGCAHGRRRHWTACGGSGSQQQPWPVTAEELEPGMLHCPPSRCPWDRSFSDPCITTRFGFSEPAGPGTCFLWHVPEGEAAKADCQGEKG